MNLALDIGNTRCKFALFDKDQLVESGILNDTVPGATRLLADSSIRKSILCTVKDRNTHLEELLSQNTLFSLFTYQSKVPLDIKYKSVATLGSDRTAAVVGSFCQFPNTNVLTIDSGTCIKFNFVNKANEYLGGAISPGIDLRFKSMNDYTDRLPLLEPDYEFDTLVGDTTRASLQSGVMNAIVAEVEKTIEWYNEQYSDLKVVITGGNHEYFVKRLKTRIFADPFLILRGLNHILNLNS